MGDYFSGGGNILATLALVAGGHGVAVRYGGGRLDARVRPVA